MTLLQRGKENIWNSVLIMIDCIIGIANSNAPVQLKRQTEIAQDRFDAQQHTDVVMQK